MRFSPFFIVFIPRKYACFAISTKEINRHLPVELVKCFLLFICTAFSLTGIAQTLPLSMPAEWEKQQAIFVNYAGNPNNKKLSNLVQDVCRDIIRELSAVTKA